MPDRQCPFCELIAHGARIARGEIIETGHLVARNEHAVAFRDSFPVSRGHTLVVPLSHEADLFALSPEEQQALWSLALRVASELRQTHLVDGFNIGANAGAAAGQTVAHAHLHVIPRYTGDVADPRGGVRWVIPAKADLTE